MSRNSRYVSASDGLLARKSGAWAKEKLHYLRAYMTIFNNGMKAKWSQRSYIDLMAGPGRCITPPTDEFDGSPLLSLRAPHFTHHVFVEALPKLMDALQRRAQAAASNSPTYICADCNDSSTIAQIRDATPRGGLALAFVDNLGLDVTFETIALLTDGRRTDLVITFQVSDLRRNVGHAVTASQAGRFDRFFGSPNWREVVSDFEGGLLNVPNVETALTDFYVNRLATIGYGHVAQLHTLMKNDNGASLYRLILAAKHDRATDFFQKISKKPYSGQQRLW
jgi:three-Cys-motif partner protein